MYLVETSWQIMTTFTLELFYPIVGVLIVFDFIGSLLFNKR